MKPLTETLEQYTHTIPETGCHWWMGGVTGAGYGVIGRTGGGVVRNWLAHRVAYEATKGPIPKGLVVRHTCDNPRCVNPDHLLVGTMRDNSRDCVERGRARGGSMPGASNPQAKLTWAEAAEIREATGSHRVIAERYGVSRPIVSGIKNGTKWNGSSQA